LKIDNSRPFSALCDRLSRLLALAAIISIGGCGGRADNGGASSVDPGAAAEKAIELFDKDGSGSLNESELAASPAILAARDQYDSDASGDISQEELEARLTLLFTRGTSWLTADCQIYQGNRPLAGATVRFVPEPFLEEAMQPAQGTTNSEGVVNPAVADEKLPENLKGLHVMQIGVYRVEVEHPNIKQPHKPLGCEISDIVRGGTAPVLRL
jgi:hypothetical protein